MTLSLRALLTVAAVSAVATSSYASIIPPNTPLLSAPSFANPVPPVLGGVVVDGGVPISFVSTPPFFSGTATTSVVVGDPLNPFGPGALTFIYSVSNDATSTDSIERITLAGYAGFIVDAGFAGPGTAPSFITRTSGGDVLGFYVNLAPGDTTAQLIVRTNALFDSPEILSTIDGATGSAASFGPAPGGGGGTPEPASLGLLGLGGLAVLRRRSR